MNWKTARLKKNRNSKWQQHPYTVRNPSKYVGDVNNVWYLSSWELRMNEFLDSNPDVMNWSSEEIGIPYIKPTDKKMHYYYPDYWVKYKDREGNVKQEIIEVKPDKQTKKSRSKKLQRRLIENVVHGINMAKWRAAANFCNKYNIKFRIITEKDLFR